MINEEQLNKKISGTDETVQLLVEALARSESRYQSLERILRWAGVAFICLIMVVFYISFELMNNAQASGEQQHAAKVKFKPACQSAMPLIILKQMPTPQQIQGMDPFMQKIAMKLQQNMMANMPPTEEERVAIVAMGIEKNAEIFCNIVDQTNKLLHNANTALKRANAFQGKWRVVRTVLMDLLKEEAKNSDSPIAAEAKKILESVESKKGVKNRHGEPLPVLKDSALLTYLIWGVVKGFGSLDELQKTLEDVKKMKKIMQNMDTNMYKMNKNMEIMSYDMDSTIGRMGRNLPMPW